MLFYPIHLPWPILLHALGLTALGCSLLFKTPTEKAPEDVTTLGIATVGLGMSWGGWAGRDPVALGFRVVVPEALSLDARENGAGGWALLDSARRRSQGQAFSLHSPSFPPRTRPPAPSSTPHPYTHHPQLKNNSLTYIYPQCQRPPPPTHPRNTDLATSYMPISQNQFLHASAPVRIVLASLALLKYLLILREPRDSAARRRYKRMGGLLGVALYDGLGGLLVGWYLGTLGGKAGGY
ncbi:hypothetical protein JR316_0007558 [Psilocybe cubensis]|uniref:Uncharacterized protein n=2 Tax=Psilocybe cubensis TaxID=181762 RepID=A0A8H8CH96_PSICU|nr:hypothetical protein JR316_0007558 [Psilocybe cubensis]KAH9480951.1 hypothetical protein JR316_0007558 [Psilocybe cubensis]